MKEGVGKILIILATHLTKIGFIIENMEDTVRFSRQQLDNHSVIGERNITPAHSFTRVF